MGSTAGRLAVARRAALRSAIQTALHRCGYSSAIGEKMVDEIEHSLASLGWRISMIGGDMIWGQDEEPPEAAEILARESCPRCGGGAHRIEVEIGEPGATGNTIIPGELTCDLGEKCSGAQVEIVFLKDGE